MRPANFYETPEEALQPLSAGTYVSYICAECIIDGEIISTPLLNTPHPTYLNQNGKAVVQTQCVELGGNGLNA